mmetsp:Transcript_29281/g.86722  ORF Transcript_29281/g.86722 Transcript_29281/m.86722 type:complete len:206 (+) Transcript_29281:669-1286(+)
MSVSSARIFRAASLVDSSPYPGLGAGPNPNSDAAGLGLELLLRLLSTPPETPPEPEGRRSEPDVRRSEPEGRRSLGRSGPEARLSALCRSCFCGLPSPPRKTEGLELRRAAVVLLPPVALDGRPLCWRGLAAMVARRRALPSVLAELTESALPRRCLAAPGGTPPEGRLLEEEPFPPLSEEDLPLEAKGLPPEEAPSRVLGDLLC